MAGGFAPGEWMNEAICGEVAGSAEISTGIVVDVIRGLEPRKVLGREDAQRREINNEFRTILGIDEAIPCQV